MRTIRHLGCAAICLAAASGLMAQISIGDISDGPSGSKAISEEEWGETFTVPVGNSVLDSVEAQLKSMTSSTVEAYIFDWDATSQTFGTLEGTATQTVDSSSFAITTFAFAGGLDLTAGSSYAMLFYEPSVVGVFGAYIETAAGSDAPGTIIDDLTTPPAAGNAGATGTALDVLFEANLTPAPEAASMVFGGLAVIAGLAAWHHRRRAAAHSTAI